MIMSDGVSRGMGHGANVPLNHFSFVFSWVFPTLLLLLFKRGTLFLHECFLPFIFFYRYLSVCHSDILFFHLWSGDNLILYISQTYPVFRLAFSRWLFLNSKVTGLHFRAVAS